MKRRLERLVALQVLEATLHTRRGYRLGAGHAAVCDKPLDLARISLIADPILLPVYYTVKDDAFLCVIRAWSQAGLGGDFIVLCELRLVPVELDRGRNGRTYL